MLEWAKVNGLQAEVMTSPMSTVLVGHNIVPLDYLGRDAQAAVEGWHRMLGHPVVQGV